MARAVRCETGNMSPSHYGSTATHLGRIRALPGITRLHPTMVRLQPGKRLTLAGQARQSPSHYGSTATKATTGKISLILCKSPSHYGSTATAAKLHCNFCMLCLHPTMVRLQPESVAEAAWSPSHYGSTATQASA